MDYHDFVWLLEIRNMLIKTWIVINKNTQQLHKGPRFDQLMTNIEIKNLFIYTTL